MAFEKRTAVRGLLATFLFRKLQTVSSPKSILVVHKETDHIKKKMNFVYSKGAPQWGRTWAYQKLIKEQWGATREKATLNSYQDKPHMSQCLNSDIENNKIKSERLHFSLLLKNSFAQGSISSYALEYSDSTPKTKLKDKNDKPKKIFGTY